jgi:hypothetical protein
MDFYGDCYICKVINIRLDRKCLSCKVDVCRSCALPFGRDACMVCHLRSKKQLGEKEHVSRICFPRLKGTSASVHRTATTTHVKLDAPPGHYNGLFSYNSVSFWIKSFDGTEISPEKFRRIKNTKMMQQIKRDGDASKLVQYLESRYCGLS